MRAYLQLTRIVDDLGGDLVADQLRDILDTLWYEFTSEEHAALDLVVIPTVELVKTPSVLTPTTRVT
jgi:hypothetical protein